MTIEVLRHTEGRQIIAGTRDELGGSSRTMWAGHLVPAGGNPATAIRKVASEIGAGQLAVRCIQRLQPEQLD